MMIFMLASGYLLAVYLLTSSSKENRKKNLSYRCFFGFSGKAQAGSYGNTKGY
ncbi:MAG: hypothetical protein HC773_13810 [Scytonema sp. CRU_2_7]|nr:hypothetical protein [Scytonema sp. CRU_2_7]